jgi:cytochrome oxidase Cu insertion factor (SCO1/SenC/PrrC family)
LLPVAGLGGFVLGLQHEAAEKTRLPVLGEAPRYTLTNQLGEKVSSTSLLGRVQLVTFLFPYCTTLCPLIAAHLTNLEAEGLRPAGIADKVAIVSFNIDPGNTGPHEMRGFLRQYGWEPQDLRWQYLVGPPAEIRRVVSGGFSVWYKRVSLAAEAKSGADAAVQPEVENKLAAAAHANYDIVHNDVIELVDQRGRIRKVYDDADTVDWQDLLAEAQSLIDQRQ